MSATDTQFAIGQSVIHADDNGELHAATVTELDGDLLHLSFADGDEGWEYATSCHSLAM